MATDLLADGVLVFAVIAGIELIDRTSFAVLGLAAKNDPRSVWAGASAAYVVTTTFAVLIGAALLAALGGHVEYLRLGGGAFLIAYAGYLALVPESERRPPPGRTVFATAFLLIVLLELGDTTMIFTIVFVSAVPNLLVVGVAAALGLICVAGIDSILGARLGAKVEPKILDRVVIAILVVVGVVTILSELVPGAFPSFGL
jgi:putative Ca2+/H+ antiporter (TMEM165/GDT1 family)